MCTNISSTPFSSRYKASDVLTSPTNPTRVITNLTNLNFILAGTGTLASTRNKVPGSCPLCRYFPFEFPTGFLGIRGETNKMMDGSPLEGTDAVPRSNPTQGAGVVEG